MITILIYTISIVTLFCTDWFRLVGQSRRCTRSGETQCLFVWICLFFGRAHVFDKHRQDLTSRWQQHLVCLVLGIYVHTDMRTNRIYCTYRTFCIYCKYCTYCTYRKICTCGTCCTYCTYCTICTYCTYCTIYAYCAYCTVPYYVSIGSQ